MTEDKNAKNKELDKEYNQNQMMIEKKTKEIQDLNIVQQMLKGSYKEITLLIEKLNKKGDSNGI